MDLTITAREDGMSSTAATPALATAVAMGAPALPDYAPIPKSALGPALNDKGYYVGRVNRSSRST